MDDLSEEKKALAAKPGAVKQSTFVGAKHVAALQGYLNSTPRRK